MNNAMCFIAITHTVAMVTTVTAPVVKVELMVKSVVTDCKECLRKCQRLGSEASHFSETVRLQHRSVSSQLQSLSDNCAHLPVLRYSRKCFVY